MPQKSIFQVKPGDKLSRPIFSNHGTILLDQDVVLNEQSIKLLVKWNVLTVHTGEESAESQVDKERFSELFSPMFMSNRFIRRFSNHQMGIYFQSLFGEVLEEIQNREEIIGSLMKLAEHHQTTFQNSIHTMIMSSAIGVALHYTKDQLIDLAIGALAKDLGHLNIDIELLEKKGTLSPEEWETVRKHPEMTYRMLQQYEGISAATHLIVLQHHERMNGSGYPFGLKSNQIHEYAMITAISDVYHSLTAERPYRSAYLPHDSFEYLLGAGDTLFPYKLIQAFQRSIAVYPVGTLVVLNTGDAGYVTGFTNGHSHRPVIRVVKDFRGVAYPKTFEVDLSKELTTYIKDYTEV